LYVYPTPHTLDWLGFLPIPLLRVNLPRIITVVPVGYHLVPTPRTLPCTLPLLRLHTVTRTAPGWLVTHTVAIHTAPLHTPLLDCPWIAHIHGYTGYPWISSRLVGSPCPMVTFGHLPHPWITWLVGLLVTRLVVQDYIHIHTLLVTHIAPCLTHTPHVHTHTRFTCLGLRPHRYHTGYCGWLRLDSRLPVPLYVAHHV